MSKEALIEKYLQEHSELKARFVYEEDLADMLDLYAEEKMKAFAKWMLEEMVESSLGIIVGNDFTCDTIEELIAEFNKSI